MSAPPGTSRSVRQPWSGRSSRREAPSSELVPIHSASTGQACGVLRCDHTILPVDQDPDQPAASPGLWHGGEPAEIDPGGRPNRHRERGRRTTNATIVVNSVVRSPELFSGIQPVQEMLGHLSECMSKHHAKRAEVESMNRETVLLLPDFGNQLPEIAKHKTARSLSD